MRTSYESYDDYLARKRREYPTAFDPQDLDPRFLPYFGTGQRIRVRLGTHDKEVTGFVSVTTGWKPCFLLMRRRRDHRSLYLLGPEDVITAVQVRRTYISVPQPA